MNASPRRVAGLVLLLAAVSVGQGALIYPDIIYYKFNEGSGTAVTNFALPGNSLYTPQWELGGGGLWETANPMLGAAAMNFAGLDRLRTNWPSDLTTSLTIECWIKTNFDTTAQQPCGTGQANGNCTLARLWGNYTTGMNLLRCYIGFYNPGANFLGGGWPALQTSTANVTDTNWHHIALVYDATAMTLTSYVDGMVDQMATAVPGGGSAPTSSFFLGGTSDVFTGPVGTPFNGIVDEFRVWGEARTPAQILTSAQSPAEITLPVQATFNASTRTGPTPLITRFLDLSSTTDPGGVTNWAWDFGDGTTMSGSGPTFQNPCHVYTMPGLYTVSLSITTAAGMMDTVTVTNFIDAGQRAFVAGTCGQGDLLISTPPPPPSWLRGYTLASSTTSAPVGAGWLFGLIPDGVTFSALNDPPTPGGLFHFLNVGNPALYPEAPLVFPNGSFPGLAGVTIDGMVLFLDNAGVLLSFSNVSRFTF